MARWLRRRAAQIQHILLELNVHTRLQAVVLATKPNLIQTGAEFLNR